MRKELEPLLTPWKIGNVEIKNRIVLTSMGGTDLFGWMEKNHFDKDGAKFILEVAKNNCGGGPRRSGVLGHSGQVSKSRRCLIRSYHEVAPHHQ